MLSLAEFEQFELPSIWVYKGEKRLNASSYNPEFIRAQTVLDKLSKKGFDIVKLNDLAKKIFVGARSKRIFTSKHEGVPYLMPIDIFMFHLRPRKWISLATEDVQNWWVKSGTILITQSGSSGRVLIANKLHEKYIISQNVVRVIPIDLKIVGYLAAYLESWVGQSLITKDNFGATVKHIEPEHVANIPIPRIPEIEKEIHEKIMKAHEMIEKAQELLLEAERMIYTELGLPEIDEDEIKYFGDEDGRIAKVFTVSSRELGYRLDASYHAPLVEYMFRNLEKSKFEITKLKHFVDRIIIPPRFKRPYIKNPKYGVPYLEPSHLPLIKYFDIKYLSKYFPNYHKYRLNKEEVLVVTDGSVGWIGLVTNYLNGWYGSNNFARLTINRSVNVGYIVAFLYSEYGQIQLKRETFGGVVNHITEEHILNVKLPKPPRDIQDEIGNRVIQAYDLRDSAIKIEEEAVKQLEQKISELAGDKLS